MAEMALRVMVAAAVVSAAKKSALVVTIASDKVYVALKTSSRDGSLVPVGEEVRGL